MSIISAVKAFFSGLEPAAGERGVLSDARPLIVGVSGGPDSVALLHVLARAAVYPRDKIVVAHLNHLLRPSAAAEASFVAALANEWQLTFRTREVTVKTLADDEGLSLEAAARQARYAFLAGAAREFGAAHIAVGHNQNDQVETVLMHLIRGSGLAGLRGMQPVSAPPNAPELKLLRPLLAVSRTAILAYCAENELEYVEDESNQDVSLLRNRIRHELLPVLTDYNPQITSRLATLTNAVDADENLLAQILEEYWGGLALEESDTHLALNLAVWRTLPLSMKRRSLRRAALSLRPDMSDISFEVTELARLVAETGQSGNEVMLPGGVKLALDYDRLLFLAPEHRPDSVEWPQLLVDTFCRLSVPGEVQLAGDWALSARRLEDVDFGQIAANRDPWQAYLSITFADDLTVRPRRVGERLLPLGMGGRSTKIGDIMTNRKIPDRARERWPIIANLQHALWLTGHVLDERARVQPDDKGALLLRVTHPKSVD